MNKEKLFKILHRTFTGKRGQKHSTLSDYELLPYKEAVVAAESYLESAKRAQENCTSDWSFWGWEGDITIATILINVFKALDAGITDFPDIPDVEGTFLMDKTYTLQKWSEGLVKSLNLNLNLSKEL